MAGKVVAILGATGVVGTQMMQCLEGGLPGGEARAARERTLGRQEAPVPRRGGDRAGGDARGEIRGVDIVLAPPATRRPRLLPEAAKRGAVCVDNSHAFGLDLNVPLVIPEINPEDVANHPRNIISNPNCATIIGLVPTWPLAKAAGLNRLIVSTYQAASGAALPRPPGSSALSKVIAEGGEVGDTSPFAYQLAFNLIPQIGGFKEEGYLRGAQDAERGPQDHAHARAARPGCTCVRVPVMRSHSESITVEFDNPITPDEAREVLSKAPGVKVVDDPANLRYPMPLDTSDQDLVYVGRIRRDLSAPEGVSSADHAAAATRSARARRPTPSRSRRCCSSKPHVPGAQGMPRGEGRASVAVAHA